MLNMQSRSTCDSTVEPDNMDTNTSETVSVSSFEHMDEPASLYSRLQELEDRVDAQQQQQEVHTATLTKRIDELGAKMELKDEEHGQAITAKDEEIQGLKKQITELQSSLSGAKSVLGFEYDTNLEARRRLYEYYIDYTSPRTDKIKADRYFLEKRNTNFEGCIKASSFRGQDNPEPSIRIGNILADREMAKEKIGRFLNYSECFMDIYGIDIEHINGLTNHPEMLKVVNMRGTISFRYADRRLDSNREVILRLIDWALYCFFHPKMPHLVNDSTLDCFLVKLCAIDLTDPINKDALERQIDVARGGPELARLEMYLRFPKGSSARHSPWLGRMKKHNTMVVETMDILKHID